MRVESKRYRDAARGHECTLRIPGVCNYDPDTTVLAHLPVGMRGTGIKSPDVAAIDCCSACHDVLDGRAKGQVDGWDVVRAMTETQLRRIEMGLLVVKGMKPQ